jgi:hypothetical protein
VVISEGLINYFDKPLLAQLIQSIAEYGQPFKNYIISPTCTRTCQKQVGKYYLE